jgi:hypothetical protein
MIMTIIKVVILQSYMSLVNITYAASVQTELGLDLSELFLLMRLQFFKFLSGVTSPVNCLW